MSLHDLTMTEASVRLRSGEVSPVELAESCLARIGETEGALNAYVVVTGEPALEAATAAEKEIAAGRVRGPMHGIPVCVKDLCDMAGLATTASSKVRHDHMADSDSAVVTRLKEAGAVIVGKTHTHEFAYGISTPTTRNPWNTDCIPGGSSGGTGASVAARGCFAGIGTDTGGSIRIPAALCGLVGLKPTYGRVSRAGVTSLSWSLDHVHASAQVGRHESAGLFRQIKQNRPALEHGDRRAAARRVMVHDGRHPVVGADPQEIRLELAAAPDIHRHDAVVQSHLLKRDGNLPAVRGRPVIGVDHGLRSACGS